MANVTIAPIPWFVGTLAYHRESGSVKGIIPADGPKSALMEYGTADLLANDLHFSTLRVGKPSIL